MKNWKSLVAIVLALCLLVLTIISRFAYRFLRFTYRSGQHTKEAKNVMIIPGRGFSWDAPDHFRIVMLPEPEKMAKAMRDLGDFLKDYHQN